MKEVEGTRECTFLLYSALHDMKLWTHVSLIILILDERIGNLCIVAANKGVVAQLKSQFMLLVRGMYSCPPNHGERIVTTILNDRILTEKW